MDPVQYAVCVVRRLTVLSSHKSHHLGVSWSSGGEGSHTNSVLGKGGYVQGGTWDIVRLELVGKHCKWQHYMFIHPPSILIF